MGYEYEVKLFGISHHLGDHDGVLTGSTKHGKIGVVDDAVISRVPKMAEGIKEKALHTKSGENRIKFQIPHFAVAQIQQAANHPGRFLSDGDLVRRRIMLHFLARFIRDLVMSAIRLLSKPQLTHHPGKRRVANVNMLFLEFLIDTLKPAVATGIKPPNKIGVNCNSVGMGDFDCPPFLLDDPPYRFPANTKASGYLPNGHPLLMKQKNGATLFGIDHKIPGLFLKTSLYDVKPPGLTALSAL